MRLKARRAIARGEERGRNRRILFLNFTDSHAVNSQQPQPASHHIIHRASAINLHRKLDEYDDVVITSAGSFPCIHFSIDTKSAISACKTIFFRSVGDEEEAHLQGISVGIDLGTTNSAVAMMVPSDGPDGVQTKPAMIEIGE
eukprot:scaffold73452_cov23-Cyclotella_meneghiniana.AAC.1